MTWVLALPTNLVETGDVMLTLSLLKRMPMLTLLPQHVAKLAAQNDIAKILPLDADLGLARPDPLASAGAAERGGGAIQTADARSQPKARLKLPTHSKLVVFVASACQARLSRDRSSPEDWISLAKAEASGRGGRRAVKNVQA